MKLITTNKVFVHILLYFGQIVISLTLTTNIVELFLIIDYSSWQSFQGFWISMCCCSLLEIYQIKDGWIDPEDEGFGSGLTEDIEQHALGKCI